MENGKLHICTGDRNNVYLACKKIKKSKTKINEPGGINKSQITKRKKKKKENWTQLYLVHYDW